MIRAGALEEVTKMSGDWIFIDMGFSEKNKSCGFLVGGGAPSVLRFSELIPSVTSVLNTTKDSLNIVIEAPLSIAFNEDGNPTGRRIERQENMQRYWYVGLGCCVLMATTYFLRDLSNVSTSKEIRLFEGFATFKRAPSTHKSDVEKLREVVWNSSIMGAKIISPEQLRRDPRDKLESAFKVSGMDYGVPPVLIA